MSYIGRGIDSIDNISTLDNLSFNGSDATFNLTQNSVAFVPVSADALQIQIDGVIQSGNYTCSGSQVTFDFTPSGSSVCNGIRHFGVGLLSQPSDGSVTTAKLGADSVNGSKIADNSISDEHLDITAITGQTEKTSLADADKFLISDSADSGALKYVQKSNLPSGTTVQLYKTSGGSGAGVSSISTGQIFTSDYNMYEVFFTGAPVTNDDYIKFRYIDNTGADVSHNYYHTVSFMVQKDFDNNNENTENTSVDSNINHGRIYVSGAKGSNNHPGAFRMTLFDPRGQTVDNSERCRAIFDSCYYTNGNNQTREIGEIFHNFEFVEGNTGRTAGGFKLECSTGNIGQHQLEVYGIKRD